MSKSYAIAALACALGACSAVGQLTVKDYQAKSGERVMAGQAEPQAAYGCEKIGEDSQNWGLQGNMDRAAAIARITSAAVDAAPGKGANYAYVMAPSEVTVGILNVNAFNDAEVAYYRCTSLPEPAAS